MRLVEAYLRYLRLGASDDPNAEEVSETEWIAALAVNDRAREADRWAWFEVDGLVASAPEQALDVLMQLLAAAADDEEILAVIAAGHVEDLVVEHGTELLDRIVDTAKVNPLLGRALSGIWIDDLPLEVRKRLRTVLAPPFLPAFDEQRWQ